MTTESLTPDTSPLKEHEEGSKHEDEDDDLVSTYSTTTLQWDNYASSPELSGFCWNNSTNETETIAESPIKTRYFFNKNYPQRIPVVKKKSRHMSTSENNLDIKDANIATPDAEDSGCFSTRTFFRRVRQSFGWPSRSTPNLVADYQDSEQSSL